MRLTPLFLIGLLAQAAAAQVVDPCAAPATAVVAENCLAGSPPGEWEISFAGDLTIQGFTTDISANRGETVRFKIKSDVAAAAREIRDPFTCWDSVRRLTAALRALGPDFDVTGMVQQGVAALAALPDEIARHSGATDFAVLLAGTGHPASGLEVANRSGILADPGAYYVNVHTPLYPGGEVRGQLK